MRIAVTGAAGKTGLQVLATLDAAGHTVRALARDATGRTRIRQHLDVEVAIGDMSSSASLEELFADCAAVYHIPPNMSRVESQMAAAVVDAARRTGVARVVYHSVLHPQLDAMPHHWNKLLVEAALLRSGVETVFLQPAPYMQNLHPYLTRAARGLPAPFPYGTNAPISMVDLADVAAAAAIVITGAEHVGGAYQLCSPDRLRPAEAWAQACDRLGIAAPYQTQSTGEWRNAAGRSLPDEIAGWLMQMFDHYDRYGLLGSSRPLADLLGRAPTSFAEHLEANAANLGS